MKWKLYDATTETDYEFLINPLSFNFNVNTKSIEYQPTAHGKRQLAFEGRKQVQSLSFSGTILEKSEYDALMFFSEKRKQIRLTDDLGRVMWIYITRFSPQRQLHPGHPFYFDYSVEAIILDW